MVRRLSPGRILRAVAAGLTALSLVALCVLRFWVLPDYEARANPVLDPGPYRIPPHVRDFHRTSFVADLHADPLLWARDLTVRGTRGHVDLPRLAEGGIDLQIFGVVTKVPGTRSYDTNRGDTDSLPLLFIAAWRSPATWFSPKARALAQADELSQLATRTPLTLVLRREDLSADGLKGLLSLEGMHALEGDAEVLDELHAAGFRMMGLAHHFDNAVAGSAHGVEKHGLTALGRELVPRMEALGITIDLAHASPVAFADTLGLATRPVVVSHGGVQATCPGPRNLSDEQLRSVAANGGVVGIGYFQAAVCDPGVKGIVAAILHVVEVAGVDHVALGSDFDGHVAVPFDASGMPLLTAVLLDRGMAQADVRKVLGGNVRRVLEANLPD